MKLSSWDIQDCRASLPEQPRRGEALKATGFQAPVAFHFFISGDVAAGGMPWSVIPENGVPSRLCQKESGTDESAKEFPKDSAWQSRKGRSGRR